MNKDNIAPWEGQNETHSFNGDSQALIQKHKKQETNEMKLSQRHFRTLSLPKYEKRVIKIEPKLYERLILTSELAPIKKPQKNVIKWESKVPPKNNIIIAIPSQTTYVPRVHKQIQIKHSHKDSKASNLYSDHPNKIQKYKDDQLQVLRKKLRSNSTEFLRDQQYIAKKTNPYQQQIIKRCSLKVLNIYDEPTKAKTNRLKLQKIQKNEGQTKGCHILDRILSRFD